MASASTSGSLEDFLQEIRDIETQKRDDSSDDELLSRDDGIVEEEWLRNAGLEKIASDLQTGAQLNEENLRVQLSTLTKGQAAAVRRRIDTLNATYRKKHDRTKADVRNVFVNPTDHVAKDSPRRSHYVHPSNGARHKTSTAHAYPTNATNVEILSSTSQSSSAPNNISVTFKLENKRNEQLAATVSDPGLPNFVLVRDLLGVTRPDDLAAADMQKLAQFAFIELSSLFDSNNITFRKRRLKKKFKDSGLFGVPIQNLVERDLKRYPGTKIPRIFQEIVSRIEEVGLHEEGIFRVPASILRLRILREELESNFPSRKFKWSEVRPHDAACLFKQFLRELPVPLLTLEYIDAFAQVDNIKENTQKLQALNLLILLLPETHRCTLHLMLSLLTKVMEIPTNRMTLNNLSMIMAPNLFMDGQKGAKEDKVKQAHVSSQIVSMLIKYSNILWTIPPPILSQVRHQYEKEQLRKPREGIFKFFPRKDRGDIYKKPTINCEIDYNESVIRVRAPKLIKCYTAIQLESKTTAQDIVNRFRRQSVQPNYKIQNGRHRKNEKDLADLPGVFAKDNSYLFEVGGNIGQRRLDGSTNMLALLRVNPNAEWVIDTNTG